MTNDLNVTQADRDLAAEFLDWETWEEAVKFNRRAHVIAEAIAFALNRTAHSGEGRSNGAGEDAVEGVARALFVFQHQGDIDNPGQVWDAPDKGLHPIYWVQKMEHNHPHYRAMARAAIAALSAPEDEVEREAEGLTDNLDRWGQRVSAWIEEFGLDALERELCASRNTLAKWAAGDGMPRPFARQGLVRTMAELRAALAQPEAGGE